MVGNTLKVPLASINNILKVKLNYNAILFLLA